MIFVYRYTPIIYTWPCGRLHLYLPVHAGNKMVKMAAESRGGLSGSTPLFPFHLQFFFLFAFLALQTYNSSIQDTGVKENQDCSQPRIHSKNNLEPAPNNCYGGYGCTWFLCIWVLALCPGFLQVCCTAARVHNCPVLCNSGVETKRLLIFGFCFVHGFSVSPLVSVSHQLSFY